MRKIFHNNNLKCTPPPLPPKLSKSSPPVSPPLPQKSISHTPPPLPPKLSKSSSPVPPPLPPKASKSILSPPVLTPQSPKPTHHPPLLTPKSPKAPSNNMRPGKFPTNINYDELDIALGAAIIPESNQPKEKVFDRSPYPDPNKNKNKSKSTPTSTIFASLCCGGSKKTKHTIVESKREKWEKIRKEFDDE